MGDDLRDPYKLQINRLIVTIQLVKLLTRIYKEEIAWHGWDRWKYSYPVIVISLN